MLKTTALLVLALLPWPLTNTRADLNQDIANQAKEANRILESWQGKDANATADSGRYLHIIYWTPSDRDPITRYQERLQRMMEHIRAFYAREMKRLGFGPRTINLNYDSDGRDGEDRTMIVHLVKGAEPYAKYNMQSGSRIRRECVPVLEKAGIDPDRETLVIFCNMANWDEERRVFTHNSPYYASGWAGGGTAWQLDSPTLDTPNLSLKEPIVRDGQYGRISLGKHNTIFIGGVTHELGHALGLPHNKERPDERAAFGTALMGSGNRTYGDELRSEGKGSFLTLAHGLRLASHPQFSGSTKGLNRPHNSALDNLHIKVSEDRKSFRVRGTVSGSPPVYAMVAYMDPDGGSDYDATTSSAVPAEDGTFLMQCDALSPGKSGQLRLFALHVNGAVSGRMSQSQYTYGYKVAADATVDVSSMQRSLLLEPFVKVLKKVDATDEDRQTAFTTLFERANDPDFKSRKIAARLLAASKPPNTTPDKLADEIKKAPLTDTRPDSAKVGWMRPTYDAIPEASMLLAAGGDIFEHGIYAHAPAHHVYTLSKRWNTLSGRCGVADGKQGSVVFVIKVDGKEAWRSRSTKAGTLREFNLDVSEANTVELIAEDAGDGTGGDWGLWLEPVLNR